jgi:hypothetical protein
MKLESRDLGYEVLSTYLFLSLQTSVKYTLKESCFEDEDGGDVMSFELFSAQYDMKH